MEQVAGQVQQKPRCPDVTEAIINYFRQECAIFSSNGIEIENNKLSKAIGAGQGKVSECLRRLYDLKIIVLKSGIYELRSRSPKFLALGEGHEEGNEWKRIYYSSPTSMPSKIVTPPILPSEIVKANAKATSDKSLLEELVRTYAKIKELQEQIINVQRERNEALEKVQQKQARIEELEQDLKLEAESARTNQQDISTLELQLREARSQVAAQDRQIAKSDQRVPQFAQR